MVLQGHWLGSKAGTGGEASRNDPIDRAQLPAPITVSVEGNEACESTSSREVLETALIPHLWVRIARIRRQQEAPSAFAPLPDPNAQNMTSFISFLQVTSRIPAPGCSHSDPRVAPEKQCDGTSRWHHYPLKSGLSSPLLGIIEAA
jgi:hypothetical protein